MSDYDFEIDDIADIDGQAAAAPEISSEGVSITLPANTADRLLEYAAIQIVRALGPRLDKIVRERVDQAVTETFDRSVAEIAEKAITEFLTKPRQKTNTWGEIMPGPSTTMADLIPAKVESWLTEKVSSDGSRADGYSSKDRPTRFDWLLNKLVRDELTAETKAAAAQVTEEAKKVVSASVGRFIADQLVPQIDVMRKG